MEIIFDNVSFLDKNKDALLKDVNLTIDAGNVIGIFGKDINLIIDMLMIIKRPTNGILFMNKRKIKRTNHIENIDGIQNKVGYVFDPEGYKFKKKTIYDEINEYIEKYNVKTDNVNKHIFNSLKIAGLNVDVKSNPNNLSYSEKKKLVFACVMSYNPEVILFDNFDRGLYFRDCDYFRKLFVKLRNQYNKTIMLFNSDSRFLFDVVNRVMVFDKTLVFDKEDNPFYDGDLYKYIDVPMIVSFTNYAHQCGHDILKYTDTKELIKELYRNIK
ncbi:MAG: ATP-binding cassette domain-containing protein [Bacilli bacterium]|nr:ATP-binding cassette domain-containing protein [Bacilli bacterium]